VRFKEGDTVEINTVVALIGDGAAAPPPPTEAPAATSEAAPAPPQAPASQAAVSAPAPPPPPTTAPQPQAQPPQAQPPPPAQSSTPAVAPPPSDALSRAEQTAEELRRTRSSPLVRKIAAEHQIDITRLEGTGTSGRVTKNDILSFIEQGGTTATSAPAAGAADARPSAPPVQAPPALQPGANDRVEPMSVMRRKIAEHMTMSQRTSAHVATVYEIDMTRVHRLREQNKAAFQQSAGTKLSYMPFIFQAVTQAIRQFPIFNSQASGDRIIYKRDINLGMAVALDWGLIVPVIKRADELSIAGLARAANDLAERARAKQLKPDEVAGGTFTITNPGVYGGLFGTPIINQPQVAILGVGTIEKRTKVITTDEGDDVIAIRHMAYFALSFDHRIIDGADAERFLSRVKEILEAGQFTV
ncbi:MAG: 2-oxo acid dehydrogenase subunit E2, partial [Acidobacteria bacterium]|nr:2-oxo acid dehydrogenase subunit E2 [Acidobacteriota bacterium]